MIRKLKFFLPILLTFCVILFFHYTKIIYAKYYPALADFCIFMLFFTSLFQKETIIQRLARLAEPNIKPKALIYTKKLTYVWSIFSFLNLCIATASIFMSEKFWVIYNGFVSYLLAGSLFVIEYIVRVNFKRKYDC